MSPRFARLRKNRPPLLSSSPGRGRRAGLLIAGLLAASPVAAQEPNAPASLKGGLYLRGGRMTATGDYAAMPSQPRTVFYSPAGAEAGLGNGTGAGEGYYGELGRISYLPLPLPGRVKVGIDATLSGGYMNIAWGDIYADDYLEQSLGEALVDARIGPVVSVMPLPGLRFDAAFKFGYGAAGGSSVSVVSAPIDEENTVDVSDTHHEAAAGATRSFTVGARFRGLTIGWETHTMSVSRERSYSVERSDGEYGEFVYTSGVSPSTTRLFIGISR